MLANICPMRNLPDGRQELFTVRSYLINPISNHAVFFESNAFKQREEVWKPKCIVLAETIGIVFSCLIQ